MAQFRRRGGQVHSQICRAESLERRRMLTARTSWALAPGYLQSTCTVGGEIGGYCASGRLTTAIAPASVITIESTAAKIGRSIKKREITLDSPETRPVT